MRTLFHFLACPFCMRTRIVLDEKHLDYESVVVDPGNKPAGLLERNPRGTVPTLDDDGVVLQESHVIDEYLEERDGLPQLMPSDPASRAQVRLWQIFCDGDLAPAQRPMILELRKPEAERDPGVIERGRRELARPIEHLSRALERRPYLVGAFSLADVELAPFVVPWKLGHAPGDLPAPLRSWIERLRLRPSIAREAFASQVGMR